MVSYNMAMRSIARVIPNTLKLNARASVTPLASRALTTRGLANWAPALFPRHFNNLFDIFENTNLLRPWSHTTPWSKASMEMDMKETDQAYEAIFNIPGVKKEDIKVSFEDHVLTVSVDQSEEKEHEDKDAKIHWKERNSSYLSRSVQLPSNTKTEGIQAHHEDGVLKITIPKSSPESSSRKLIEVS